MARGLPSPLVFLDSEQGTEVRKLAWELQSSSDPEDSSTKGTVLICMAFCKTGPSPLQLRLQGKPHPICTFTPAPSAWGVAITACLEHGKPSPSWGTQKTTVPSRLDDLTPVSSPPCFSLPHTPSSSVVPSEAAPPGLNTLLPATRGPENRATGPSVRQEL